MTLTPTAYDLIPSLPLQFSPERAFVDLYTLVPNLLDLHPSWSADDVQEFVEEKTRRSLHPEDLTTLLALHRRCVRLRREFDEGTVTLP